MKYLLLITTMAIFSSCDTASLSDTASPCDTANGRFATNIDLNWSFYLRNDSGEDLLDPSTPGYFVHADIKLYRVDSGVKTIISQGRREDALSGWLVDPPELSSGHDDYIISIRGQGPKIAETKVSACESIVFYESFIEFKTNNTIDIDTIKTEARELQNSMILKKVWYNGKLFVDRDDVDNKQTIIVK